MEATQAWYAFQNANTAGENVTWNTQGDTLALQVFGDATSVSLQVFGQVDTLSNTWVVLNALDVSTLQTATTIAGKGIFFVPVDGLGQIKIKLVSVSGGKISVFGRITRG